jgi:GT2 family glycosyltransferase
MDSASIGVVVVNWNGYADSVACLTSLLEAEPGPLRVVVVDNGSDDDSAARLSRWMEQRPVTGRVTLLASPRNLGFAGGANVGIEALCSDGRIRHYLLLNNDATVRADFFAELGRALEAAPDAAILGATIYEAGSAQRVWYAGGTFVPLRALAAHRYEVPSAGVPVRTDFVTGCAMLISREARDALGPLPECYFMYLEDAEYSHRANAAGLPVLYAPRAVVLHAVGASVERFVTRPRLTYWVTRSRALFVRRNLRGWRRWGALLYLIATKPARALIESLAGRPRVGWCVLRGTAEGLLSEDGHLQPRHARAAQPANDGVVSHH